MKKNSLIQGTEDERSGGHKHLTPWSHPSLPAPPRPPLHLCCVQGSLSSTEEHRLIERRPSCSWSVTVTGRISAASAIKTSVCVGVGLMAQICMCVNKVMK